MSEECHFAGCEDEGTLRRHDRFDHAVRWYCSRHDPLDDDAVADSFEVVEA